MHGTTIFVLIGALLSAACGSPTEPRTPAAFVSVWERHQLEPEQAFTATAEARTMYLDGYLYTPDPCYGFAATVFRRPPDLIVTLVAHRSSPGCAQPLGRWNFRVTVPQVPRGTWRVSLRTPFADESFHTTLTIP